MLDMNLSPLWKNRLAELRIESEHWSTMSAPLGQYVVMETRSSTFSSAFRFSP